MPRPAAAGVGRDGLGAAAGAKRRGPDLLWGLRGGGAFHRISQDRTGSSGTLYRISVEPADGAGDLYRIPVEGSEEPRVLYRISVEPSGGSEMLYRIPAEHSGGADTLYRISVDGAGGPGPLCRIPVERPGGPGGLYRISVGRPGGLGGLGGISVAGSGATAPPIRMAADARLFADTLHVSMSRWNQPSMIWGQFFWNFPDQPRLQKRKKTHPRTMSSNATPDNNNVLRALADRLADGCHNHEVALGIKQNTEAVIRAAITPLAQAELQLGLKKAAVPAATLALQNADTAGTTTITNCKLRLAKLLGQRWSAAWEPTGFPHQSTAVPETQDERFTLLDSLKNYFAVVPASESVDMEATAALCGTAWTTLSTAREGVSTAESALTAAFTNRDAAAEPLRKRVRGLITELETLLSDEDPMWENFGLNIPANPSAPEPVPSLTVTPTTNHRLEVAWEYAVRAIRYRVETFIVGVDEDWVNKASAKDLEIILKGFTAGQTVKVRIVAGNDGGDAAPSPEAQAVVT